MVFTYKYILQMHPTKIFHFKNPAFFNKMCNSFLLAVKIYALKSTELISINPK